MHEQDFRTKGLAFNYNARPCTYRNQELNISIITDSICTSRLFRQGVKTSAKLASNTRLQRELCQNLSNSFPKGIIKMCWAPSNLNLADCLTKIQKKPVEYTNSPRYRQGVLNNTLSYLEVHSKMLQNTFYTCKAGKEQYYELEVSKLNTAGFENKSRETFQNKKKYLSELHENKKIQRGLESHESVSISCINCTGSLLECTDIQQSVSQIYPQVNEWVDDMINNEEISNGYLSDYPKVGSVFTRSKSKVMPGSLNVTKGQLVERKIHRLMRRVILSKLGQVVGSIYSSYQPKFDHMLISIQDFEKILEFPNISFEKLLRLVSFGLLYYLRNKPSQLLNKLDLVAKSYHQLVLYSQSTDKPTSNKYKKSKLENVSGACL